MNDLMKDGTYSFDNSPGNTRLWNRFVRESPTASFYHSFEWKTVNETEFNHDTHYLASVSSGQVNGILPLVLIRSRIFGRILCSLPFVNYCGPSTACPSVERQLLDRAYEFAREEKVDYIELRTLRVCDESLPRSQDKVSMTVRLSDDPDALWDAYKSKHRNNIRRIYKSGLHVKSGQAELLDTFYALLSRSWRDLGTPIYRKQYFRSILDTFGSQVRIFVAYKGDTPISTALNGYFGNTVEGMWAGSAFAHRHVQSNYVLYWEMIKNACEEGYESFHLGRTSVDSGGEAFKKKWNADMKQLYWQYYLPNGGDIPQLNVNNPKFRLAISAWRKTPLWLTQVIGPAIARNIP